MNIDPEKFVDAMNDGFECRRCGTCCIVWRIPVTDADVIREPLLKEYVKDGFMIKDSFSSPCPFYDVEEGCIIHKTRPQTCRDFKASPVKCMAARISTSNIDVGKTVEDWKEQGIDEATILSRIFSQYITMLMEVLKKKNRIIGGTTLEDDLERDFLLKTVKERAL